MAELGKVVGMNLNPDLIEELLHKHFGPEFTSKVTWDFVKGKFVPSDLPRRIVVPQKVFALRIGWKTLGEFTANIGFRLELWDASYLPQAKALVEDYNSKNDGAKLELCRTYMAWPASQRETA